MPGSIMTAVINFGDEKVENEISRTAAYNLSKKHDKFVNLFILGKSQCTAVRSDLEVRNVSNLPEKPQQAQRLKSSLCSKCGKSFSSNFNLKRHMTSCKLCPDREKAPRHQCECGRTYSQEWDMKKHKASCGKTIETDKSKCKKCLYCSSLFYHRLQLQTHMKLAHNITVEEPQIYDFENIEEFKLWKEKMEEDTYTYYSKQTGGNVTGVSVNTYYVCQHDGSDRVHSSSPRKSERRNKKGRVKTGMTCWSQMNVKEFRDGSVRVTYHPSHTHPVTSTDTKHHPLPSSITDEIHRRVAQANQDEPDILSDSFSSDSRKTKKKCYSLNARNLRALARKNRKLFRITAEAINEGVGEELNTIEGVTSPTHPNALVQVKEEVETTSLVTCNWYCTQLKAYLDSGQLSASTLLEAEGVLSNLIDSCRRDVLSTTTGYDASQDGTSTSIDNPLQVDSESNAIYQVVAQKEDLNNPSPTEDMLYQNAVQLIGHREYILITHDPQVFQSTMPEASDD